MKKMNIQIPVELAEKLLIALKFYESEENFTEPWILSASEQLEKIVANAKG